MTMSSPSPALPSPQVPYDQDAEHLRILSICWYVFAALHGAIACFGLIYVGFACVVTLIGATMGTLVGHAAHDPVAAGVGLPFVGMGILVGCFGLFVVAFLGAIAFLHYKAGKALAQRTGLTLIYVMSAIACLAVPFGTVLGVFTFIVLARPSVRASFR